MKVFIHSRNNLSKIVIKYLLALIPLYIYGIYKNGILLYTKDLIGFFEIFKLLYLVLIGLLAYLISSVITKHKLKIDLDFLGVFIVPLFMPFKINYIIYFVSFLAGSIINNVITKKLNYNKLAFLKLGIIIFLAIFSTRSYLNPAEELNLYAFSTWDILWGRGVGGLGSTSIILSIAILIYLSIFNNYKYLISITSLIVYIIIGFLIDANLLLMGSSILAIILISPFSPASPIENKAKIIYGFFVGLIGILLEKYVISFEGIFISILICSIIYELICKISKKVL